MERTISTRLELTGETEYRRGVSGAAAALEGLGGHLKTVSAEFAVLEKAQRESEETGRVSIGTLVKLTDQYPALCQYLEEAENGYRLADGALQDYLSTQRAEYEIALHDAQTAADAITTAEADKLNAINATTLAAKDQLTALASLYQSMGANAENEADLFNEEAQAA